ncbi:heterokaryon incompatibility protein-domain-containing protein [Fomes fomentarius]|nr:heterokaryon incompatibility protein-domain-containing protein [Fomes fomentarius]
MRLLQINTGLFHYVDDPRQVRYVILSHVWGHEKQEQSFQEARAIQESSTQNLPHETCLARLSQKVQRFCAVARRDGYDYGWVDTVCIDKTSIPELSEAINSMYDWYRLADACYAILDDVDDAADREQFRRSKWFTRGWTLQELIAPKTVLFLSDQLELIGSKQTLSALIEAVTGVERAVLTSDLPLEALSIAHRISWAAWRNTSRFEDEAYSLMGLLGVRMPVLYGEGRYAFRRLQEELLKNANPDQTLFAWGSLLSYYALDLHPSPGHHWQASSGTPVPSIAPANLLNQSLLASSPHQFKSSSHLKSFDREAFSRRIGIAADQPLSPDRRRLFETTSQAIDARFPLVGLSLPGNHSPHTYLALLACEDREGRLLSLILRMEPIEGGSTARFSVGMHVGLSELDSLHSWSPYARALLLSQRQLDFCLHGGLIAMTDCTFRHLPPLANSSGSESQFGEDHASFEVRLSGWSRRLLSLQGYRISPPWDVDVALHDCTIGSVSLGASEIVISGDRAHIVVRIGRCICELGSRDGHLGILMSSNGPPSLLERRFVSEQPHSHNHPVHLDSWIYPEGISTKDFELTCRSGSQVTVRITFAREAPLRNAQVMSYQLGIELLEDSPPASYSAVARSSRSDASPSGIPENNSPQSNGVPLVSPELEAGTDSAEAAASRTHLSGPLTASGVRSKRSSLDSTLTDQSSVAGWSVQARLYGDPSTSYSPTTRSRSPSPSRWPFKHSLQASFMPNLRPPPSIASSESLASIKEHGGFSSMDDRVLAAYQGRGSSSTYLTVVGSMARSASREVVSSAGERADGLAVLPTIVQEADAPDEPDSEHESARSQGYRVFRNSGKSPAASIASSSAAITVPQDSSSTATSRVQEGMHSDVNNPTDHSRKHSLRRTLRSLGLAFKALRKNV